MIWTDNGTRVPWDWCPLALANGIEWGATQRRYERLYRPLWSITAPLNWALYLVGFFVGKMWSPSWIPKRRTAIEGGRDD